MDRPDRSSEVGRVKGHIEIRCSCKQTICRCMCSEPRKLEIREHPACTSPVVQAAAFVAWGTKKQ